jgi:hypothetical protein
MLKKSALLFLLVVFGLNLSARTGIWSSPKFYTYYHKYYSSIPSGKDQLFDPSNTTCQLDQINLQTMNDVYVANFFLATPSIATNYVFPRSYGKVHFAVDWDQVDQFEVTAYKAVINVDIDYQTFDGSSFSNTTTLTNVSLEIYYDPTQGSQTLRSEAFYLIDGAHDVNVHVNSLTFYNLDGSPLTSCTDLFPLNVTLDASIESEFIYKYTEALVPADLMVNPAATPPCTTHIADLGDRVVFNWCEQSTKYVEGYDLEWTFVSDNIISSTSDYNFRNNSSRVRVYDQVFEIPKIYPENGTLIWRLRAVGKNPANLSEYVFSDWTSPESGTIGSDILTECQLPVSSSHESGKNWQYSVSFAEDGKYKEVIGYADGTLRSRQTVTRINTNDSVLVAQKYYDWQGRPAVEALPAPVYNNNINYSDLHCPTPANSTDSDCDDYNYGYDCGTGCTVHFPNTPQLKYYNNFNGEFGLEQFDVSGEDCAIDPQKMTDGAGFYYSPSNINKDGKNKLNTLLIIQAGSGRKVVLAMIIGWAADTKQNSIMEILCNHN